MWFRRAAPVAFGMALYLPGIEAFAQSWGQLECDVIREYVSEREERLGELAGDRQLLALALRGVDFEAYGRVEGQLSKADMPADPSGAVRRMTALLSDRCGG